MGRTRSFDEAAVLVAAGDTFLRSGYEATSIDDLVTALGVHRGSLYNTFGSKRGLFLGALDHHLKVALAPLAADPDPNALTVAEGLVRGSALDLILVAAIERGHEDAQVASTVRSAVGLVEQALGGNRDKPERAIDLLGARLYARLADQGSTEQRPDRTPATAQASSVEQASSTESTRNWRRPDGYRDH